MISKKIWTSRCLGGREAVLFHQDCLNLQSIDQQELLGFYVSDNYKMLAIQCVLIVWPSMARVICFAPTKYHILVGVNINANTKENSIQIQCKWNKAVYQEKYNATVKTEVVT